MPCMLTNSSYSSYLTNFKFTQCHLKTLEMKNDQNLFPLLIVTGVALHKFCIEDARARSLPAAALISELNFPKQSLRIIFIHLVSQCFLHSSRLDNNLRVCVYSDHYSDYGYERRTDGKCTPAFWFHPSAMSRSCTTGMTFLNSTG